MLKEITNLEEAMDIVETKSDAHFEHIWNGSSRAKPYRTMSNEEKNIHRFEKAMEWFMDVEGSAYHEFYEYDLSIIHKELNHAYQFSKYLLNKYGL